MQNLTVTQLNLGKNMKNFKGLLWQWCSDLKTKTPSFFTSHNISGHFFIQYPMKNLPLCLSPTLPKDIIIFGTAVVYF